MRKDDLRKTVIVRTNLSQNYLGGAWGRGRYVHDAVKMVKDQGVPKSVTADVFLILDKPMTELPRVDDLGGICYNNDAECILLGNIRI